MEEGTEPESTDEPHDGGGLPPLCCPHIRITVLSEPVTYTVRITDSIHYPLSTFSKAEFWRIDEKP